jgi:phenylacetate-coenzyme A ligase PaaK-like adenylate-forming protein
MRRTPLEKWISDKIGTPGPPGPGVLRKYQLEKLRETIDHVKRNSRFYKERLSGFDAGALRSLDDVASLPFTYPADIAGRPNDFLCVSPRDIERIVTLSTSGTTGNPKRVFFTRDDQELTVDFFHRGMTTFTDGGDRVLICMPGDTQGSVGDLLKKGLDRLGCGSVVYGPVRDEAHALHTLAAERITCIVGIPSQIVALARLSEIAAPVLSIQSVLLSADYVPEVSATLIGRAWGAAVYGHYGMTETGLGGGVECEARNGYHLREADLLFEIVDPFSGAPVPDGKYGEIVFSTLTRRGMPLIRYRTGDRARFLPESCPCGAVLRRLDRVTNRLAEPLRLSGGCTLSVTQLDEALLKEPSVCKYSAELRTVRGRDCLRLTVKATHGTLDPDKLSELLNKELPHVFYDGLLLLEIHEGNDGFFTSGTLKRKISDLRNY